MSWTPKRSIVALIPARAGSKRIAGKNTKLLAGHPLIAYTIAAAQQAKIFQSIVVSSDDEATVQIGLQMGVAGVRRPEKYATDISPDIEWVKHALTSTAIADQQHDCFAILRPTSPFRSPATIKRAWLEYERTACDSLRAIEPCPVNIYKLWTMRDCEISPLFPTQDVPPWHSRPTQTLPIVYQQNASLEISRCDLVRDRLYPSITGPRVWGFLNEAPEGFDLNTPEQWAYAESKIASGDWTLPTV